MAIDKYDGRRSRPAVEVSRSRWSLALALFGFLAPLSYYSYLSNVVFRTDMGWWEGGGAMVFLLFALVIFALEVVAVRLAIRSRQTFVAKITVLFVVAALAFLLWSVWITFG